MRDIMQTVRGTSTLVFQDYNRGQKSLGHLCNLTN